MSDEILLKDVKVHSDKRHKPRYWVTATVFESDSGSDAIQWVIDQVSTVTLDGEMELNHDIVGKDKIDYEKNQE